MSRKVLEKESVVSVFVLCFLLLLLQTLLLLKTKLQNEWICLMKTSDFNYFKNN